MIVDNCSAHPQVKNLKSITLKFLPPNTTAKLQPCDQGIIQNLKSFYRRRLLEKLIRIIDSGADLENINKNISLLDALHLLRSSWQSVSKETIANCFRHAGFVPEPSTGDACIDGVQQGVDGGNGEEGMHPDIAAPDDVIHEGTEVDDATTGNDVETSQRPDNIFERLQAAGFPVPNVTFEEYATVDEKLPVTDDLTDAEIVRSAQQNADDSCTGEDEDEEHMDDSVEPPPAPTSIQDFGVH